MNPTRNSHILTVNGGSSSIKFALYQVGKPLKRGLYGKVDRVGLGGTNLTFHEPANKQPVNRILSAENHKSAANGSSVLICRWSAGFSPLQRIHCNQA